MGENMKKKGFTLSEVLIVLGIIGIVAALSIPTLINKIQKHTLETQLKETYSTIQQVMRRAQGEGSDFQTAFQDGSMQAMKAWFDEFIIPYMKVESVCYNQPGCWHPPGAAKNLNGTANVWENENGWGLDILTFTTAKGAWFDMDGHGGYSTCRGLFGINATTSCLVIYFDINGNKPPNTVGKDIYVVVQTEKGLVPAGNDKTKAQVESNCNSGNGYWCLQKVINDSWTISDNILKR